MFRPMRRSKQALSAQETKALLSAEKRGILAVNGDEATPSRFLSIIIMMTRREKFLSMAAKAGHKVDALKRDDKVCFTVYGNEAFEEGDWAPYLHSVIVFGRCKLVADAGQTEDRVRELALKYYPTKEEAEAEIAKSIHAVQLYEITIEHMTGKRVHEK